MSAATIAFGFENWRPILYAYVALGLCPCAGQVLVRGEAGKRALFVLARRAVRRCMVDLSRCLRPLHRLLRLEPQCARPAASSTASTTCVPDRWTPISGTRCATWSVISLGVFVEYAIAFGLALLLNAEIRARKFFRVAFLLPLMLSPVAVSWMIGKSMLETRFGPLATLARLLGWDSPAFFATPGLARLIIMAMDAWIFIPFMMIMILAGLQAIPKEVQEAAKVDGATAWRTFWQITFPLMLPVAITAIVIRIIFKLKLADIVINVTSGGPGGATDTVTSFIFREYRDRSNVGYGTMLADVLPRPHHGVHDRC